MDPAPNIILTCYTLTFLFTVGRLERYITGYGQVMWRLPREELRRGLGRGAIPAGLYRMKLVLIATTLYSSGHQLAPRDVMHNVVTAGLAPLPPIQPDLRWWTEEELAIHHEAL